MAIGMQVCLERGDGAYVHYTCYGAADPEFMSAFNIRDVTPRSFEEGSAPDMRSRRRVIRM